MTDIKSKQRKAIVKFLQTLYPAGTKGYLNVWTKNGNRSQWFNVATYLEQAADYTITNQQCELWYQTGLMSEPLGEWKRGTEADAIAVPAIHADIDWCDPQAHKAKGLPPDIDAARDVIRSAPLPPSMVIVSGHGLQPYWLFDEPLTMTTADARARVKRLIEGWQAHMRDYAKSQGWEMDSTPDLARLMRICGTHNLKVPENPKPVTIDVESPTGEERPRYTIEQLENALHNAQPWIVEAEIDFEAPEPTTTTTSKPTVNVSLNNGWEDVQAGRLTDEQILEKAKQSKNGELFTNLWNGRADGYQSRSEAFLTLANILAFYTKDAAQGERLLEQSPFWAEYTDKHKHKGYITKTFTKASVRVSRKLRIVCSP